MQYGKTVSKLLSENLETMKYLFHEDKNKDIVFRSFQTAGGHKCFLVFIDGMADGNVINDFIIRPLVLWNEGEPDPPNILQINTVTPSEQIQDAVSAVLNGDTAVFLDGFANCYTCETKGFERRSVSTPSSENTVKGSQEAFTESIRTNTTLIHRIVKSTQLVTEFVSVGGINQDLCAVMYLDDVVNKQILEQVKTRLSTIQGDFIMGSGMVEQMIEDNPFSLFPSMLSTERPDRASHYLASGRILVVIDGSPFVIILPVTLPLLLDSPEGSSQRWQNGTFSRLIRMFALICTTMVSGVYIALILFHREMIPTTLLGAIVEARSNIPFPTVFEVLVMELFFELVREAALRIPHMLGSSIGIVGALILGQAAVDANLVSPVTLIVVALSGLGNAALPDYDLAFGLRSMKIFVILMAAGFGFLGLAIAFTLIITVLSNQNSFGVPMLSMEAVRWSAGTPVPYQLPLWKQESRPRENKPQKSQQAPKISRPWFFNQKEED